MPDNKRAVFLDRDGTINPDSGYISDPQQLELYPFSAEAVRLFNKHGFYTFIVTNQSGVARGFFDNTVLEEIHQKMLALLQKEGAYIDRIFFSPYHKEGKVKPYDKAHDDRKPGLGMFRNAKEQYHFTTNLSFMIGDRYSDIVFGKKAGLTTILVTTGEGKAEFLQKRHHWEICPDFIVPNLLAAAKFVVNGIT